MKALTVSELIDLLKQYPKDMPCFATWEGVIAPIQSEYIEVSRHWDIGEYLEFDVEAHYAWKAYDEAP